MTHLGAVSIAPVDLSSPRPALGRFTYPRYRRWLETGIELGSVDALNRRVRRLAVAAWIGSSPVGLALAACPQHGVGRLLSIMVDVRFRRCGIGSALLTAVEEATRAGGTQTLLTYFGSRIDRTAFVGLLDRCGWSPPKLAEFRLAAPADWTERMGDGWPPFLDRLRGFGFSASPWSDLSAEERARALAIEEAEVPKHWTRVEVLEAKADPAISIALRRHGTVEGWIHGETCPGETFHHYVSGYVRRGLQRLGWLVAGLDAVCRRQAAVYGPTSVAIYETEGDNPAMVAFMKRRLTPITIWMDERYRSEKRTLDDAQVRYRE